MVVVVVSGRILFWGNCPGEFDLDSPLRTSRNIEDSTFRSTEYLAYLTCTIQTSCSAMHNVLARFRDIR